MFSATVDIKNDKDKFWEVAYLTMDKFKNKYDLTVRSISECGKDKISFSFKDSVNNRYYLYFSEKSNWFTFECDTNVDNFSEKYKFLEGLHNENN